MVKRWLMACVAVLLGFSLCYAQESVRSVIPTHSFKASFEAVHFDYDQTSGINVEDYMYGVYGGYTYHDHGCISIPLMFETDVEYATSNDMDTDGWYPDYSAGALGGQKYVVGDSDNYLLEVRCLVGYDFTMGKHIITPYVGYGYRYWNMDNPDVRAQQVAGNPSVPGFEQDTEYHYSPIGVKTISPLNDKWVFKTMFEFDLLWDGKIEKDISDANSKYEDTKCELDFGDGYGFRLAAQIERKITSKISAWLEPYIKYWNIKESDQVGIPGSGGLTVVEPKNDTTSWGIRLGGSLSF